MKAGGVTLVAAAALVGLAAGRWLWPVASVAEPAATKKVAKPKMLADNGLEASNRALRARVADLERQLAELRRADAAAGSNAVSATVSERPTTGNPREWLEKLKVTDPQRYQQTTNRFARWRQHREARNRAKLDFLSSVDVSRMGAATRETHAALAEALTRRSELEAEFHREDLSDDERRELFEEWRSLERETRRLNGEERKNLLAETAASLGFEGEDAQELTTTIQEIIQATESDWGPRGFGGRRGGPPPPR